MNLIPSARAGRSTAHVNSIAADEKVPVRTLLERIKAGTVVIPQNRLRRLKKPCGIGAGLRTKINANLGTSTACSSVKAELEKLRIALEAGADAVMDLSVGGDIPRTRREILAASPVPVGTVPVYEVAVAAQQAHGDFRAFSAADMLRTLEAQARDGVDFFTIHSGVTRSSLGALNRKRRIMGIVSRGGALIASWMRANKKENPFYEYFDKIIEVASAFDITLSLGDGLRPGSILDATDPGQLAELKLLGELRKRAWKSGVQVIIEGPGHVPLDQIERNIRLQKKYCANAPFYVLCPLVTDVAPGYDHITSAIGGALAASAGADFLCYVTPAEHLKHPDADDVREGVIAARIAAHAADIAKNYPGARAWDEAMSKARRKRDWKRQIALAMDPRKAKRLHAASRAESPDVCTMCGTYCSIKLMEE